MLVTTIPNRACAVMCVKYHVLVYTVNSDYIHYSPVYALDKNALIFEKTLCFINIYILCIITVSFFICCYNNQS